MFMTFFVIPRVKVRYNFFLTGSSAVACNNVPLFLDSLPFLVETMKFGGCARISS